MYVEYMLNLFLFTNAHFEIGEIVSDWGKHLVSEDQKVAIENSEKFFKNHSKKKKDFFFWQQPCKMKNS